MTTHCEEVVNVCNYYTYVCVLQNARISISVMSTHVTDSVRHCLDNIVAICFLGYEWS